MKRMFVTIAMLAVCGCVRTVYRFPNEEESLKVVRMERGGVSGIWMPDACFRSIRANAELTIDLMNEAEAEAN